MFLYYIISSALLLELILLYFIDYDTCFISTQFIAKSYVLIN